MRRLKRTEVSEDAWRQYIIAENEAHDALVKAGFYPQGINDDFTKVIVFKIENQGSPNEHREIFLFNTWQEAQKALC